MQPNNSHFKKGIGAYRCVACQEWTRDTGHAESSVGLCRDCYDDAGAENEHLDNHEPGTVTVGCRFCRAEQDQA